MAFSPANYTQIPNEFIEKFICELTPAEVKVMLVIFRFTIGYHRRSDKISISQFMDITGLSDKGVRNSYDSLEEKGFIKIKRNGNHHANEYFILIKEKKNEELSTELTRNSVPGFDKETRNSVPPTKKDIYKERKESAKSHKKKADKPPLSEASHRLATSLLEQIRKRDPKFKPRAIRRWREDIDMLMRKDDRTEEEIQEIIRWLSGSSKGALFWTTVVLSGQSLRKNFSKLVVAKNASKGHRLESDTYVDRGW